MSLLTPKGSVAGFGSTHLFGEVLAQHYLKSAKLRVITLNDIAFMSEDDAFRYFVDTRWGSRETVCCPHCGTIHRHYFRKNRNQWRCKDCDSYFSVTTGTPFQDHKLSFKRILMGMSIFISGANSVSLHQLSRLLNVQVKTAQTFVGKVLEIMMGFHAQEHLDGWIQIDGGYFGGRPRQGRVRKRNTPEQIAAHVEAKLSGKINSNKPPRSKMGRMNWKKRQKRRVVMVLRELYPEPGMGARKTIVAITRSENDRDAIEMTRQYVNTGALIMTDENPAYDRLSAWYTHKTVQHSVEYSTIDGVNDNQAESYYSRLRRYVLGVGHRIEPKYLKDIAVEMAWRQDMRRNTEGEKLKSILTACFKHGLSKIVAWILAGLSSSG